MALHASWHIACNQWVVFFTLEPRMKFVPQQLPHWLVALPIALALHAGVQAETVARYGISMADIPLTTGQPDRGAGAYQFTGHTLYDPLVAWEANIGTRPGKLVPGLASAWKADVKDPKNGSSPCAKV